MTIDGSRRSRRVMRAAQLAASIIALAVLAGRADEAFAQEYPPAEASSGGESPVRPTLGIGFGGSDSGFFLEGQAGLRLRRMPVLLRLTGQLGGRSDGRTFFQLAIRGDWIHEFNKSLAGLVGLGVGGLAYGWFFDDPVLGTTAFLPEIGVILGPQDGWGWLIFTIAAEIPTTTPAATLSRGAEPPRLLASLVFSI